MSIHLEFLVEELSAEVLLRGLIPKVAPEATFEVRVFNGKQALLRKLSERLRGYASWISSADTRIVVLVDRDDDDCHDLKSHLVSVAEAAGLSVASYAEQSQGLVLNRIVIEELEAWFLGDPNALTACYPRVPITYVSRAAYRDPDAIKGGTWEALERLLQQSGYIKGGLAKVSIARELVEHMSLEENRLLSFQHFRDGLKFLAEAGVA